MSLIILKNLNDGKALQDYPTEKKCKDCGEIKPLKKFKKNRKMKDNRENTCYACYSKHRRLVKKSEEESEFFNWKEPAF